MKKKYLLVILVIIILIVLTKIIIDLKSKDSGVKNEVEKNVEEVDKSQKISFQIAEYESVDDIVFYNKNKNITEKDKENFNKIASSLKKAYPGKQIVYEYSMGESSYRCRQYIDGYIIDDTWMNVNSSGGITFTIGSNWKSDIKIEEPKITYKEAENITKKYLSEHKSDFNEMAQSSINNKLECTIESYYYKDKNVWNMNFSIGNSYLIIDAKTGEIIDTYFFSGKMID